jgi:hypothetical protein
MLDVPSLTLQVTPVDPANETRHPPHKSVRASHQITSNVRNQEQKMVLLAEVARMHIAEIKDEVTRSKRIVAQSKNLRDEAAEVRRRRSG